MSRIIDYKIVVDSFTRGESIKDIADELKCNPEVLRRNLNKKGLQTRRRYSKIRPNISETQKAYIAGLFDGEGHVSIQYRNERNEYSLQVGITNAHMEVLKYIINTLETGNIYTKKQMNNVPVHYWKAVSNDASWILEVLNPFLIIKKEVANLAIRFQKDLFLLSSDERFEIKQEIMRINKLT